MFREFHTLGAATGKAREENTVVAGGCCSSKAEADRRFLVGRYLERLLERYADCPDRLALYVMVASLNVIRCLMGSRATHVELQWHQPKTAVQHMLSNSGLAEACPSYIQMFQVTWLHGYEFDFG